MQHFKVVKDDSFYWVIVRVNCKGEWNSDQFVERGDGCLNDRSRIATFFEKLAHFFRFVRKIRIITAQTSDSKKLRIGNGIFDMGWVG